jgi:hypothetical protein
MIATNAEAPTPNIQLPTSWSYSTFGIGHSMLDVPEVS